MKRTLAILGVAGLGLISLTAPAVAAPNMVTVCHDGSETGTGWDARSFNANGLNGHDGHAADIIPPNPSLPGGLNWTNAGKITYIANCAPLPPGEEPPVYPPVIPPVVVPPVVVPPVVVPPVVVPPVEEPVVPPAVVPPVVVEPVVAEVPGTVTPAAQTPAPQVAAPKGAAATAPAAQAPAAVSQGTNQGFNAQTSVGGAESAPTWLAGLGLMLGAGALVAVRRRSTEAKAD